MSKEKYIKKPSSRALTFNKSFLLSIIFHSILLFGITITAVKNLPIFQDTPIINVKFANSEIDIINNGDNFDNRTSAIESFEVLNSGVKEVSFGSPSINQIKRLEETSQVTNAESLYLNLWQRNIEMSGNEIMQNLEDNIEGGSVQILAKINASGELIDSQILISSGNQALDVMAIDILKKSAPFQEFDSSMLAEYQVLEIVRDWNFSSVFN